MFDLNNNDISTVLLLIVLGLLIWYLTKPNNEKFTNNLSSNTPTTSQIMQPVNQVPVNQVPVNQVPVNQVPVNQAPVNQAPVNQAPVNQVPVNQVPVNQVPVNQVSTKAPVNQIKPTDINNFQEFDGNYDNYGADINNAFQAPVQTNTTISAVDINKKNVQNYDAKDFLPKEINDQWFNTDFSQAKTNINDDKLINTERYVIGINTVGQSLKNASYDIRGTIANPKFSVSPWNNSTYEPDYNIKPLC